MLITVERFTEPWEAHLFRMRLEAEDIPALIVHEYHIWTVWPYSLALGGAKVQVRVERYREAREIWRMCADGQFRKLLEERFGDLDGIRCPYCSSADFQKSPSILVAVSAALSMLLLGAMFPAKATIYECRNCMRSWRRKLGIPVYEASMTAVSAALVVGLVTLLWSVPSRNQTEHGAPTYPFSRYPLKYPTR